ncbi:MAG: class I SAM-dependent methyltransferase [Acidimicrobiales bacterium]
MGSFASETADQYSRYRRGYPDVVVDAVVQRLGLGSDDAVLDMGCGTGLLTRPLARRTRIAIGVDPEADMLAIARQCTDADLRSRVVWLLGSDAELLSVQSLLGPHTLGAITIGQALHFMDYTTLFRDAKVLLRTGGGVAVISNGVPLWQQDSDWSRALRDALEGWFRVKATATCGTDIVTQRRYAEALATAGYEVSEIFYDYEAELTFEQILGGVYSSLSPDSIPIDRRDGFAEHLRRALAPTVTLAEAVPVRALVGLVG